MDMKITILFLIVCFGTMNAQTGCVPTVLDSNILGFVCSDQRTGPYNNTKPKIRFTATDVLNIHTISTVGETDEDTEIYLYDNLSNTILAYNDDDSNCGGCKQSTIVYNENVSNSRDLYVVIAKKGCNQLTLPTSIKYNARNPYNIDPKILSPIAIVQCIGSIVQFTFDPTTTTISAPWVSLTPDIVRIDATTGLANFLTTGIATIQLRGNSSCNIINHYVVKGSLTSSINH